MCGIFREAAVKVLEVAVKDQPHCGKLARCMHERKKIHQLRYIAELKRDCAVAGVASLRNITDTARSSFRTPAILHDDSKAGAVCNAFQRDASIVGVRMSGYELRRLYYGFHTKQNRDLDQPGFAETSDHYDAYVHMYDICTTVRVAVRT